MGPEPVIVSRPWYKGLGLWVWSMPLSVIVILGMTFFVLAKEPEDDEDTIRAILRLQEVLGIPETGELDKTTMEALKKADKKDFVTDFLSEGNMK